MRRVKTPKKGKHSQNQAKIILPHDRDSIKTAAVQRGIMKSEDMEDMHHLLNEKEKNSMKHFLKEHERQKTRTNPMKMNDANMLIFQEVFVEPKKLELMSMILDKEQKDKDWIKRKVTEDVRFMNRDRVVNAGENDVDRIKLYGTERENLKICDPSGKTWRGASPKKETVAVKLTKEKKDLQKLMDKILLKDSFFNTQLEVFPPEGMNASPSSPLIPGSG